MAHPFSVRLPYVAKLDNEIQPGQSLIVRGQPNGDRFDINLSAGTPDDSSNIIFHVSVRLNEKQFVLNTKVNGQWGKEERHKCHLEKGTPFNIRIRCHEKIFELFVDGKAVAEYEYRAPLVNVGYVHIGGQLVLNAVGWEGNYYPVPYKIPIPGGFGPGRKLLVALVPIEDQFSVNFLTHEDYAFHFNPRFHKKVTVNNSQLGGSWGREEVLSKIPFDKNKTVDLLFNCEKDHFTVFVNGEHYCDYVHRVDPKSIDTLLIMGKMELQVVNFE